MFAYFCRIDNLFCKIRQTVLKFKKKITKNIVCGDVLVKSKQIQVCIDRFLRVAYK